MFYKYILAGVFGSVVTSTYFLTTTDTTIQTQVMQPDNQASSANFSNVSIEPSLKPATKGLVNIDSLTIENQKLRLAIEKLESKVADNEKWRLAKINSQARINKIKNIRNSIEANVKEKEWLDKDIDSVYAKPFSDFIKNTKGIYRKELHEFQFEPIEQEWAYELETKIRDFIQLNEFGHLVEISLLNCKSYRCQLGLLVQEPEKKAWKRIYYQMSLEPWFKFHKHYSAPIVNDSFVVTGNFFFMEGIPSS